MSRPVVTVRHFTATFRENSGAHEIVKVITPKHTIEVCVSPKGRSVQVHIDGERVR